MKDLAVFQNENVSIQVGIENETVWLTQSQLAELFVCSVDNISLHIKNIFKEGELEEKSVVEEYSVTAKDGKNYKTKHYNLEMVISLGCRVNSKVAVRFRQWANKVLKELMTKGEVKLNQPSYTFEDKKERALAWIKEQEQIKALEDKSNRLETRLGEAEQWYSVKRMLIETGIEYNWKPLKNYSKAYGYEMQKTFDKNYGEVNAYHIDVWNKVYGLEL
jgi:prophage antirepressor-like protein